LEAHDAPKTPPEEFDQMEDAVPNVSNNEVLIANQNNLAQHIDIVENTSADAMEVHGDTHHNNDNREEHEQQNEVKSDLVESEPFLQVNQRVPEAAEPAPAWPEPSNQETTESESSNQQDLSTNQVPPSEPSDTSINQSEPSHQMDVAEPEPADNQPAYDLLGDLGAVVPPTFPQQDGE